MPSKNPFDILDIEGDDPASIDAGEIPHVASTTPKPTTRDKTPARPTTGKLAAKGGTAFSLPGNYAEVAATATATTSSKPTTSHVPEKRPMPVDADAMDVDTPSKRTHLMSDDAETAPDNSCDEKPDANPSGESADTDSFYGSDIDPREIEDLFKDTVKGEDTPPPLKEEPTEGTSVPATPKPDDATTSVKPKGDLSSLRFTKTKVAATNDVKEEPVDAPNPYENFEASDESDEEEERNAGPPPTTLGLTYLVPEKQIPLQISHERLMEAVPADVAARWEMLPGAKLAAFTGNSKPTNRFLITNERILDGIHYHIGPVNAYIENSIIVQGNRPSHRILQPHLIQGLTMAEVKAVARKMIAVTRDSIIYYVEFPVPNGTFIFAIPGFPVRDSKLAREAVRASIIAGLKTVEVHINNLLRRHGVCMANIPENRRFQALTSTIDLTAIETTHQGSEAIVWLVDMAQFTTNREAWNGWRNGAKTLEYFMGGCPYTPYEEDYHCSCCHGLNHPTAHCPFRRIEGFADGPFPTHSQPPGPGAPGQGVRHATPVATLQRGGTPALNDPFSTFSNNTATAPPPASSAASSSSSAPSSSSAHTTNHPNQNLSNTRGRGGRGRGGARGTRGRGN